MDSGDWAITISIVVGVLIIVAGLIFGIKASIKQERLRREKVLEEYEKQPEYAFCQATVLESKKVVYYTGVNISRQVAECTVVFQTEEGEKLKFQLREEVFDRLEKGQKGTLVTVNGNFFDFGDGEEVPVQ